MDGPNYRISGLTGIFMAIPAIIFWLLDLLFDLLVATALLSDLVAAIATFVFGIWFFILKIN